VAQPVGLERCSSKNWLGKSSAMSKTYRVKYSREPEGGWMVQIPGNPGSVSWGKSIRAAREMIRDALALCLEDDQAAAEAEFDEYP